jgi:hypothetical protein
MAIIAAPARLATDLRERVIRRAEVVGVWAVECVCAHRSDTDWALELLGDNRHHQATLDAQGYQLESFAVERICHQHGTALVRLVCGIAVQPSHLPGTLGTRPLRGIVEELLLASARARATAGRLIDVAVVQTAASKN